jgi:anthranilate synthase/phosphoribosyltransferase
MVGRWELMIILIDNLDSFSYNLYQLLCSVHSDVRMVRNDSVTVNDIEELAPGFIVLSPGSGRPADAGVCVEVIKKLGNRTPILGICLGHQAICEAFGGTIVSSKKLVHGKSTEISLDVSSPIFRGLPSIISVAGYHSVTVPENMLPEELEVIARASDGEVMAVKHKGYDIYGLQFHPESILTPEGKAIMENFLGNRPSMIKRAILSLSKKEDLSYEAAESAMNEIMTGEASPIQMSAYLTALSLKGETIDEITASASCMRKHCIRLLHDMYVLEIVGTGGDGSDSFNISTAAAIIAAAAGVPVAKHGNRGASSKCGSADVLEALGVNINITPEKSAELLKEINICFLFAQNYHIAMKYVAPVRRELGIRTVFNILGPLTNPAGAKMELMGVYDKELVTPLARVLANLGVKNAMVVHGNDGLDEVSISSPTTICELKDGWLRSYEITPEQFGLKRCSRSELAGGTPDENAMILKAILNGEKGAKRDASVLNAAAALYVTGKYVSIDEAVNVAKETIDSGRAIEKLNEFIRRSNM